jgi:hypothetical protein
MKRFPLSQLWRKHPGRILVFAGALSSLALLAALFLNDQPDQTILPAPSPSVASLQPGPIPATTLPPTPTRIPPTPTLQARTVTLNPAHGIHAPVGFQWTEQHRTAIASFKDAAGVAGAPGLALALSTDMQADNNSGKVRMEQDLYQYQRQGAEIFIRLYPQRFPGGYSEPLESFNGRNTISGTPEDAAEDIYKFLSEQHTRNGWHFTRLIPGNEPDLEWPDQLYAQNLLAWTSRGDPAKYTAINRFYADVFRAWQRRASQPDAALFRDVMLYFPPLAQDAGSNPDTYAGFYYYEGTKPVGNRYDRLREAIELYGRFSWHNYFVPGRACQDVAAATFPDWLKQGLEYGWPAVIGEAGWGPDKLALPAQNDSRTRLVRFWKLLGVKWEERLYVDERPHWLNYDDPVNDTRFEEDIIRFTRGCYLAGIKPPRPIGVSVWLAGSEGNFEQALGVEPGPTGKIRRWMRAYAGLNL